MPLVPVGSLPLFKGCVIKLGAAAEYVTQPVIACRVVYALTWYVLCITAMKIFYQNAEHALLWIR